MPARSQKQANLFRLVRAIQKGDVSARKASPQVRKMARSISPSSVKHFTKVKEIINKYLNEAEYSVSKLKKVSNKSFSQELRENVGVPFDTQELLVFQNKQTGFGGFGKVKFYHNRDKHEVSTELFSNETTKKFVFKKLVDAEDSAIYKYYCAILKTYPNKPDKDIFYVLSNGFSNSDISEKTETLTAFINRINSYGL